MQRLKTKAQFQVALAAQTVARTAHFALHRMALDASPGPEAPQGPTSPAPDFQPGMEPPQDAKSGAASASHGSQALFAVRTAVPEPWVGVVLPKRWAKRAVTRNAIRRQVYSVSHEIEASLPPAAHVVRLRTGFDRSKYTSPKSDVLKHDVRAELQQLFRRAARP